MTTVLIATGVMNAGGAETLIMEILRRRSGNVRYYLLIHHNGDRDIGMYDEEIKQLGIPILYIPSVGSVGVKAYERAFLDIVKRIGHIDILHSHLNAVGGVIAKAAKRAGITNRIVHCHADITFTGSRVSKCLSELKLTYLKYFVNRYATEHWACSDQAARRLFGSTQNARIIQNMIFVKDYLPDPNKTLMSKEKFHMSGELVLGSVGRIARIKNYELIIRVLAELKKRGQNVQYICFGRIVDNAYYCEIQELAVSLGVSEQMCFAGNSSHIPFDIRCIDLLLMPSHSEGFGMAAVEAQAAGIPVLVSKGVPKTVDMGLSAVRFLDAVDEQQWADAIQDYSPLQLNREYILAKFDQNGFNSDTMVKKIESDYLLAGK